ncbi:MAG: CHC2 zinc finger domain-containing protein [Dehalobacterium sp.]
MSVTQIDIFQQTKGISLIDLVNRYCPNVKMKGTNRLVGICPLHSEKTGSFTIYKKSNSWYCFGCERGGDGVELVRLLFNLTPLEAAKLIAEDFGLNFQYISLGIASKRVKEIALERKLELVFNDKVDQAYDRICFLIRTIEKSLMEQKYKFYMNYPWLVYLLPTLYYLADVLINGDVEEKARVLLVPEVREWLQIRSERI